jgi:hypothetical protein
MRPRGEKPPASAPYRTRNHKLFFLSTMLALALDAFEHVASLPTAPPEPWRVALSGIFGSTS